MRIPAIAASMAETPQVMPVVRETLMPQDSAAMESMEDARMAVPSLVLFMNRCSTTMLTMDRIRQRMTSGCTARRPNSLTVDTLNTDGKFSVQVPQISWEPFCRI